MKKANTTTPEKVIECAPQGTTTGVASDAPKKISADIAETNEAENAKRAGDNTPEEATEVASEEAATELTADKDFKLVVTEALKKVDLNLSV